MKRLYLFCRKYAHILLVAFFACVTAAGAVTVFAHFRGNVLINEVCTSNVACCMDENGGYPDWVELNNPTDEIVDISGYILTGSEDLKSDKFVIPEGTVLAPGSFCFFDPGFTLSSDGCRLSLLDTANRYVDHVEIPALKYDTTYSRQTEGSLKWGIKTPTPGYSNADGSDVEPVAEGGVMASYESGFYEDDLELALSSSNWGRKIYYTVDGTDPRTNGILYEGPVHIYDRSQDENVYSAISEVSEHYSDGSAALPDFPVDKCTVVRAAARDWLGKYTDISTFTYFIGYDKKDAYSGMSVVTVNGDPDDLFSHENGIMVLGKDYDEFVEAGMPDEYEKSNANFTRRGRTSEREVNIGIFDETHKPVLDTSAGLRIKGLSSRWDAQKSFAVIFREAYDDHYQQTFWTGGTGFVVHSLALDKCGQDTDSKMMDVIMDRCMADSGCLTARSVPCCLFVNGEYWGFYWLKERFDRSLVSDRYGVQKDDVEFIDKEEITSDDEWNEDNFNRESLLEYYASNIIVAHDGDWPDYNVRFWRTITDDGSTYGDGKLRPVIFDMNSFAMVNPDYDVFEFMLEYYYPFVKYSNDDENFRQDLVDKIDEMSADEFRKDKVLALIDELHDMMRQQMILDKMRYTNCSADEAAAAFDAKTDVLRSFFNNRWQYLDEHKERYLNGE